jgi:hypothetical protein
MAANRLLSPFHFGGKMDTPIKRPFWAWVFCETDGTPSFARVGTAVLLGFACGWVTALVRHNNTLPEMGGLAMFVTALYGANKFTTFLQNRDDKNRGQ